MNNDIRKISVRQGMILFIIVYFAPAIRYIPVFSSDKAKQAAWISPIFAFIFGMLYTVIWWIYLKKYEKQSFIDIVKDIMGKICGNIIVFLYFLWITYMLAFNLRMYAVRMVTSVTPGISIIIILLVMLIVVGYVIKNGIIPLAKMGEIFIIALFTIFFILNTLILPQMNIRNLFPVTYKDLYPAFKGSFGILAIFSYNIILMIFNDKMEHKNDFKKLSTKTMIILCIMSAMVIYIPLSVFGATLLNNMPIPYLSAMSQISLFDIVERVEAGVIIFWVFSDFILVAMFLYSALHIIRLSFNLTNIKPLLVIYIIIIFFLSLILAKSTLELDALSKHVLTYLNLIMGFIFPTLIFIVGKIRKKV